MSLVPIHVVCARRLLGQSVTWADNAREILKQAHPVFKNQALWSGAGPWYVIYEKGEYYMKPVIRAWYENSYHVIPDFEMGLWIFEVMLYEARPKISPF